METKGRRILVVDDDRENIDFLTEALSKEGHSVTHAAEADGALHRVRAWKPHLILLDVNMPGKSGIDIIPKIRSATADDYSSIILMSGNSSLEDVTNGLEAGADDFMTKPFRVQDLMVRIRIMLKMKELQDSLRRATTRLEELSSTDDLTGVLNLRALQRRGEEEIQRSRRFRKPISGLMINLDQFSAVNELSGFVFGSQVLKAVSAHIRKCVRSVDLICRVGADEFFVLLPETDLAGAEYVGERIRDAVQNAEFAADRHNIKITASIGIAGFDRDNSEGGMIDLFKNAHEALRSAKLAGANRIEIYSFA